MIPDGNRGVAARRSSGSAGALAEAGLARQALGWSLASFNIGVEIGQAAILVVVLPVLEFIRRRRPPPRMSLLDLHVQS